MLMFGAFGVLMGGAIAGFGEHAQGILLVGILLVGILLVGILLVGTSVAAIIRNEAAMWVAASGPLPDVSEGDGVAASGPLPDVSEGDGVAASGPLPDVSEGDGVAAEGRGGFAAVCAVAAD
jgi:hypothetical protein